MEDTQFSYSVWELKAIIYWSLNAMVFNPYNYADFFFNGQYR